MNIYDGAHVVNNGYFDVPISNEYSNKPIPRNIVMSETYTLNNKIANTINNNIFEYIVNQTPTYPSPDLVIESDVDYKEYFENNNNPRKNNFFTLIVLVIILCTLIFFST